MSRSHFNAQAQADPSRKPTPARLAGWKHGIVVAAFALAAPALAFQEDIHFDATFALALAAGWSWDDALVIASADEGIDENVDTEPSISVAQLQKNDRQRNAGLTHDALALAGLRTQMPLQDYLFHCFSRRADATGKRNPDVIERLRALDDDATRAIDVARQRSSKGDHARALLAIGIYLHCLQDSWSHSGYGAEPLGHVKDGTDPDNPARNAEMARRAFADTLERLSFFLQRRSGRPARSPGRNYDVLLSAFVSPIALTFNDDERVRCNRRLVERWLFVLAEADGRAADPAIVARTRSRDAMLRLMKIPKLELDKRNAAQPRLATRFDEPDACDMVFVDAFPEVLRNVSRQTPPQLCTTWPCDPVRIVDVEMPKARMPLLRLSATLIDPVDDEANGGYQGKPARTPP